MAAELWKTERVETVDDRAFVDACMIAVHQWCTSDEAMSTARRILRRKRLTLQADELVFEVQARVLRAIRNRPEKFETFNPAAYCTRAMTNMVKGLLSGRGHVDEVMTSDADAWPDAAVEPAASPIDAGDLDRFCAAIEAHGEHPVHVSAALTITYLAACTDITVDDAPWPRAGVRDDRRHGWPALWYATRSAALFPATGRRRDGQARTRQRHLEKIDALRLRARLVLMQGDPT